MQESARELIWRHASHVLPQLILPTRHGRHDVSFPFVESSASTGVTDAPLYCATSSPSTKTLLFDSSSSANASFNASLTATSLTPLGVAYVRLFVRGDREDAGRRALEKDVGDREQEQKRKADRTIREAAISKRNGAVKYQGRKDRREMQIAKEVHRRWESYIN